MKVALAGGRAPLCLRHSMNLRMVCELAVEVEPGEAGHAGEALDGQLLVEVRVDVREHPAEPRRVNVGCAQNSLLERSTGYRLRRAPA